MRSAPGVAIVTGGGTGVGAAVATALGEAGWVVVVAGRRAQPLADIVAAHPDLTLDAVPTDVTDLGSVRRLFDATVERYGRVDLLFNNAGRGASPVEIDQVDPEEWRAVVDVNLTGMFWCVREAFRVMKAQRPRGGRIINNGSVSAQTPRPLAVAYTATKHAVTGLTKAAALEGRPYDIACGQIDIGNAATTLTQQMSDGIRQADGTVAAEPTFDVAEVGGAVVYMAGLPLTTNVATLTVLATQMPYVGRG